MKAPIETNVLITGATSGIGLSAAKRLLDYGFRLIIVCRNQSSAEMCRIWTKYKAVYMIADLSDLKNVDSLCNKLLGEVDCLDLLILNAGIQYAGAMSPRWSMQMLELTFAVNHLAHQHLVTRLIPLLRKSPMPRILITASEVHNPLTTGGKVGKPAGLGEMEGLQSGVGFVMVDGYSNFNAEKAYKDSKLCNILMAQVLAKMLDERGIKAPVVAWSPGLVIPLKDDNGFFRENKKLNSFKQNLFELVARDILSISESVENAGKILFDLSVQTNISKGFSYFSNVLIGYKRHQFIECSPSAEASDVRKGLRLWKLSQNIIENVL